MTPPAPGDAAKRHAPDDAAKRHAPATVRNREPILAVLKSVLPERGTVLEVGAGSGEHAVAFSAALPGLTWMPTDLDPENLASIAAWAADASVPGLLSPRALDLRDPNWPATLPGPVDAVVSINVLHIAPWSVCEGLMAGASRILAPGGVLYLYGPFKIGGEHTAPSNAAFDQSLRIGNPSFGVRDLDDVAAVAASSSLSLRSQVEMPANNLSLIFRKPAAPRPTES